MSYFSNTPLFLIILLVASLLTNWACMILQSRITRMHLGYIAECFLCRYISLWITLCRSIPIIRMLTTIVASHSIGRETLLLLLKTSHMQFSWKSGMQIFITVLWDSLHYSSLSLSSSLLPHTHFSQIVAFPIEKWGTLKKQSKTILGL